MFYITLALFFLRRARHCETTTILCIFQRANRVERMQRHRRGAGILQIETTVTKFALQARCNNPLRSVLQIICYTFRSSVVVVESGHFVSGFLIDSINRRLLMQLDSYAFLSRDGVTPCPPALVCT